MLIEEEEFKYVRALGVMYLRLVGEGGDVYRTLEGVLGDWSKLRRRVGEGFEIVRFDEFVEELLRKEEVVGIKLRRLPMRKVLVDIGQLERRVMLLSDEELKQVEMRIRERKSKVKDESSSGKRKMSNDIESEPRKRIKVADV